MLVRVQFDAHTAHEITDSFLFLFAGFQKVADTFNPEFAAAIYYGL
jgi:hypothetical protein